MTSFKKIEANIKNSTLGGVKTPAGKDISKYNAVKHGIFKEAISKYEDGFYKDALDELLDQFRPVGFLEKLLVERIALCYLRLFRSAKAEVEFMNSKLNPFHEVRASQMLNNFESLRASVEKTTFEGYKPQITSESVKELEQIITRYDTTIENKLYKALHELQRLQAIRLGQNVMLPAALDVLIDKTNDE
ncbi:hypothetical protein A2803_01380 [Candidatus Woesebacteria bacterium RIFCSPHIGHO2_01_FULL_44_21]|uniref:Uncharacterized protein n=1 Tax=Candidatus Woesebacteria bacterium RIFCSPHIGHO2_01_FULL_44_21 TaxID=1802503 RepID=A0A1F7YZD1_9BACT|nr:MAG: hypothetical protein A2803_01380 [Candidatus Woesebacteria bacterium RIFCSPHIGHO2_01_FULL_44_21]OGM70842.1 MAG: hypothetical protein A2897_05370 [Candidatus Woesebacteria bacterium RIFCSPLOWO2_01_FULL_44_24b]